MKTTTRTATAFLLTLAMTASAGAAPRDRERPVKRIIKIIRHIIPGTTSDVLSIPKP